MILVTIEPDRLRQQLEGFLGDHLTYTDILTNGILQYKFLKRYHERDIENFSKGENDTKITFDDDQKRLKVEGTNVFLSKVRDYSSTILITNESSAFPLTRPGLSDHFRTISGQQMLRMVEDSTRVIIVDESLISDEMVSVDALKGLI